MLDLLIRTDPRYSRYLDRAHAARAEATRNLLRAVRARLARTIERYRRRRTRRRWIATLARLDDRTLHDIGLRRANIRSAVFEAERRCMAAERRARLVAADDMRRRHARPEPGTEDPPIAAE